MKRKYIITINYFDIYKTKNGFYTQNTTTKQKAYLFACTEEEAKEEVRALFAGDTDES